MKARSMSCKCSSDRIIHVNGKTSDMNFVEYKNEEIDGYLPDNIGIGGGDYIHFSYCADCGTIQGQFPLPEDLRLNEDD